MSRPFTDPADLELHAAWMRRLARGLVGEGAADDVVQEAWLRTGGVPRERGYLAAVVRSVALQRLRGEGRRRVRERRAARGEALPSSAELAARAELVRQVAEAVEALPDPYRDAIVMRYHDGLSAAEIARRSGEPAGTVRARVHRGLELLRQRLDRREGGREAWVTALLPWTREEALLASSLPLALTSLVAMKLALLGSIAAVVLVLVWTLLPGRPLSPERLRAAAPRAPEVALAEGDGNDTPFERGPAAAGLERVPPATAPSPVAGTPAGDRGIELAARAVDGDGLPLPQAWLELRLAPEHRAAADAEGRIALDLDRDWLERFLEHTARRGEFDVDLGAPGFATRTLVARLGVDPDRIVLGEVRLERGGSVRGVVLDPGGLGVEGALVAFGAPVDPSSDPRATALKGPTDLNLNRLRGRTPPRSATTGAGGAFLVEGVEAGFGTVWARTETSLWAFSEPVGVRAGEEVAGIELRLVDASEVAIAGVLRDPEGRPLPGIQLQFSVSDGDSGWWIDATDAAGRFQFLPLEPRPHDLTVAAPSWEWDLLRRERVEPGTVDLELAFEASRWLWAQVVDGEGRPLPDGKLEGLPADGDGDRALTRCESTLGADGRGRLRDPGRALRVRASAPGHATRIVGPFDPATFPDPLVIALDTAPAITGRVLAPDGTPAAGARVSLHRGVVADGRGAHLTHQAWGGDGEAFVYELVAAPESTVHADGEGRFRLPLPGSQPAASRATSIMLGGLGYAGPAPAPTPEPAERTWYVHAELDGGSSVRQGPLLLADGAPPSLELELPRTGRIEGSLLVEGTSPAGWTVHASDGGGAWRSAPVDEDGRFVFERLAPGPWQLSAFEPGSQAYPGGGRLRTDRVPEPQVVVEPGRTHAYVHTTRVRLEAVLRGRLWIDGAPAGPWNVSLRSMTPQGAMRSAARTLDPEGRFEVRAEADREVVLVLHRVEDEERWFRITVRPELAPGDNTWELDLETARLSGTVEPGDKAPSSLFDPGILYRVEAGDHQASNHVQPGEDGSFGPLIVATGRGTLSDLRRRPEQVLAELELGPGEERALDLR